MQQAMPELARFAEQVRDDGYRDLVLLGMGGSSLAPEVFQRTFGAAPGYPELFVLDTTDPFVASPVFPVLARNPQALAAFARKIERDPEWREVYAREGVLVFRRVSP
jgi:glucose-6-phosphate isomerase